VRGSDIGLSADIQSRWLWVSSGVRHIERMNTRTTKPVLGLLLLTLGLVVMSLGVQWLFFAGLALLVLSGLLSSRQRTKGRSSFAWLLCIGAALFLLWFSSYGMERPPLTALVAVWLASIVEEFHRWRAAGSPT
jgi:hypothetical protein